MTTPLIEIDELSKWFGEVVALNNLSLTIEPGVTGLLGPNGAGKSTFFKIILGLYSPSRGTARVFQQNPRNNLAVLERVGYCPESDTFFENMTGYEFVYALNRQWGMTKAVAEKAAEEVCDLVAMTERMDDPIDEYSKGMRQRIKIAQALASKPELLLLDEPMGGLDPKGREEMFTLIRRLGEEGRSVIISSHILYEVERVTDSIVLLYNGTMLAQGRVREIRDLIDRHPHTIIVDCDDPRALAKLFAGAPDTISMELDDKQLTLRTSDPNTCFQQLNDLVLQNGSSIQSIQCTDDDLQSVFEYLIK
ncbi:MAG: ABC transporter ATP-binding protein [Candidatus Hydrogenedentota bacterium]